MTPLILGVLNTTPDSFSDGGQHADVDAAVARADQMIAEGADIIDVGGESTRPFADPVSLDVELARTIPVIEAISDRVRVSIDTRHEPVARAAVEAGASLINDVSASLWPVAADTGVGWIAMHMQGDPQTMQQAPTYDDVVDEVVAFLTERGEAARNAGVEEVWIDPGFGFGKTLEHNLALLAATPRFVATGFDVVVATSRKSSLGALIAETDGTDTPAPVDERLVGSLSTATYAMVRGARMVRAHDIAATWQAVTVFAAAQAAAGGTSATGDDGKAS